MKPALSRACLLVSAALASTQSLAQTAPTAATPDPQPTAPVPGGTLSYVGPTTRLSVGADSEHDAHVELYHVIKESEKAALIGEIWAGSKVGGIKLSANWLNEPGGGGKPTRVNKLFAAFDRGEHNDHKFTLGGGMEYESLFWHLYGSHTSGNKRLVSDSTRQEITVLTGTQDGRPFTQDLITSTTTRLFERAYDRGIGVRVGKYFEQPILRVTAGYDHERGDGSAKLNAASLFVEKFFGASPWSVALNVEGIRKSGSVDEDRSDTRGTVLLRYDFGGRNYAHTKLTRKVPVTRPAPAAVPPPSSATSNVTTTESPRIEKRIVKTTASMAADAFFEFDRSRLTPEARGALDQVIQVLKNSGYSGKVRITGHTCDIGSDAYNLGLSQRRATSVRDYLAAQGGFAADTFIVEGKGEREPKYPNDRVNRPKNRRVDLEFITYRDKVEEVTVPAPPAAAEAVAPAPTPAPIVEWKEEELPVEPAWFKRALHNPPTHKQRIDTYRLAETTTTQTRGPQRFVNRPPVAVNDTVQVARDSSNNAINVLTNDSDPDNDPLTLVSVTAPGNGTAVVDGNLVRYTPRTGFSGADSFSYVIKDSSGATATATVAVTVTSATANRAPIANDDEALTYTPFPVSVRVLDNDSDPDGDTLTVTSFTQGTNGQVNASPTPNVLVYYANPRFSGVDTFTYTVSDGKGGTATAKVTVTVLDP